MSIKALLFAVFFLSGFVCLAQNWDIELLKHINLNRNRSLDPWFRLITDYAAPIAYTVPFFLLIKGLIKKNKKLQIKSTYIISAAFLALIVSISVKHIVNRPRPFVTYPFIEKVTSGGSPSFPSGHTSDAFTLAIALSLSFPKCYVIIPSILWALAVGYSRMDLGVHYPSDIIGSVVIAMLSSYTGFFFLRRKEKQALLSKNAVFDKNTPN